MDYYIKELKYDELHRTAGVKARDDVYNILSDLHMRKIEITPYYPSKNIIGKIKEHLSMVHRWKKALENLIQGDRIFIQCPIDSFFVPLFGIFKCLQKKGVRVVLIIHDLEILRVSTSDKVSVKRRVAFYMCESKMLKNSDFVIVHNEKMKEYLEEKGIERNKIISLGIFDYLVPQQKNIVVKDRSRKAPIIVAGNLSIEKAKYLYDLPNKNSYNLYGINYTGKVDENIQYLGSYPSEQLTDVLEGSFGLVWDGESVDSCIGVYGEYLKINNPHKTSLYLASGLPVIIWKQAALADFVLENKCGIVIDSLREIQEQISNISDQEYEKMRENAFAIGKKIREGFFLKTAIKKIEKIK